MNKYADFRSGKTCSWAEIPCASYAKAGFETRWKCKVPSPAKKKKKKRG